MSNSTSKQISSKELNIFFNNTTNELKKITSETVKLYNKQCQILKKQIKILVRLEPNRSHQNAHIKWEQELCTLEDNYNLIFDKYLKEKKELDRVANLNLY